MTKEEWTRIKEIIAGALDEPASTRDAYLANRCGSNDGLRREVESLIASMSRASDLFETPALALPGAPAALEVIEEFGRNRIGDDVGPYRITKELGSGGMGAAYLADRIDQAYQKQVAIKVVKRGMDSDAVIGRFRQERQILANLDHPNIARLLDGGTTHDGLPYFVMEYVEGRIERFPRQGRSLAGAKVRFKTCGTTCRGLTARGGSPNGTSARSLPEKPICESGPPRSQRARSDFCHGLLGPSQ